MKREWLPDTMKEVREYCETEGYDVQAFLKSFRSEKEVRECFNLPPRGSMKVKHGKVGLHFYIDKDVAAEIVKRAMSLCMDYQDYILVQLGFSKRNGKKHD